MKKPMLYLIALLTSASALSAFIDSEKGAQTQATIKEVAIGKQVWMIQNLEADKFGNGDTVPFAKTQAEWIKAGENGQPACCFYGNDSANGEKYGKLYNWYAVTDPRGLAPKGWHIPTDVEWTQLTVNLGGDAKAGMKMKGPKGWDENGNGTNESGFFRLDRRLPQYQLCFL